MTQLTWLIEAPIEAVWDAIHDSQRWLPWWRYVVHQQESVRSESGGVRNARRYNRRTRLPYKLSFDAKSTRFERLALLEGAIDGELRGCGHWHFYRHDDVSAIRYDWEVNVHHPWLRRLVLLSRRPMKWNHYALMLAGGQRLARHVGVRFLGLKEDA